MPRRPDHRVNRAGKALDHHALIQTAHHLLENRAAGRLVVDHHHRIFRRRQNPDLRLRHDPSPNALLGTKSLRPAPPTVQREFPLGTPFGNVLLGAGRETRTLMVLPPADFESAASTGSAIPAGMNAGNYNSRPMLVSEFDYALPAELIAQHP